VSERAPNPRRRGPDSGGPRAAGRIAAAGPPPPRPGGLTIIGAVALFLLLGLVGGVVDVVMDGRLGLVFDVAFWLSCLLVAAKIRQADLVVAVIAPPLVFAICALVALQFDSGHNGGGSLISQGVSLGTTLAVKAATLFAGEVLALLIAGVRFLRMRGQN
jgi:hypothetical protein